jgi:hypothetical protein
VRRCGPTCIDGERLNPSEERRQKSAEARDSSPDGHSAKSEALREQSILGLLSEKSLKSGRRIDARVNERTIRPWLAEPEFQAEYQRVRRASWHTLEALLGADEDPSVRLGAARTIAEQAARES